MSILQSKEKDGTLDIIVTGYLTKDPKVMDKVVLFSVCYGKKKYIDCKAWAEDTAGKIAACLEHHDSVSVSGVYEAYEGRDGNVRPQIAVDGVFPMTIPMFAAGSQPDDIPTSTTTYEELMDTGDGELPF